MKREELLARETALTEALLKQLDDAGNSIAYTSKEESGTFDIVSVEITEVGIAADDVLAHCFFLPSQDDDMYVHNFRVSMRLFEGIDEPDIKASMLQAANYLNCLLPSGAFVLDPEISDLDYIRTTAMPVLMSDDDILDFMGRELMNSLGTITPFVAPLVALAEGDLEIGQFVEAVAIVFQAHME